MSYIIGYATKEDVKSILPRLRDQDATELGNRNLKRIVRESERCLCLWLNAQPAALVGIIDEVPGIARVWFLSTDLIDTHRFTFLRACKPLLAAISCGFDLLHCYVCCDRPHAYRWAQWLGFHHLQSVLTDGKNNYLHFYYVKPCPQPSPSPA